MTCGLIWYVLPFIISRCFAYVNLFTEANCSRFTGWLCAATKIIKDTASVRTQKRRLRRDCCDKDRIGFQCAILWCSVNQQRQTFSLGVNTISRSEDWIFRSEGCTKPSRNDLSRSRLFGCRHCTRRHAAFRGETKSYQLSGIVYLFIYQLFWTQACPEGIRTNWTRVSYEVPSLPIPTTRKGWPNHRGLRPLLFSNSEMRSFKSHKNKSVKVLWDGTYGFPSLSEKTRKSNHLQMSLQKQTLSVGPVGVWTRETGALPTELTRRR